MAKAPRMSMERQWRNIGASAARRGRPVEVALTGTPSIDELIRAGFEEAEKQRQPRRPKGSARWTKWI